MMKKIIVTGGSGFIGTNLIQFFEKLNFEIYNYDIRPPQNKNHLKYWEKIDIMDFNNLSSNIYLVKPNYVFHLAARTDLNGSNLNEYEINTQGISNLISVLNNCNSLEFVVFVSSMLVCKPGYIPKSEIDYNPNTLYGESKMLGEKIVRGSKLNFSWVIVRPTSIWGPWFGEPYFNFFKLITKNHFLNTNSRKIKKKTFGYVWNFILFLNHITINKNIYREKTLYFGDFDISMADFAKKIMSNSLVNLKNHNIPFVFYKIASLIGDALKLFNFNFPLTSFRLRNLTSENIIQINREYIIPLYNEFVSFDDGITATIKWMNDIEDQNIK